MQDVAGFAVTILILRHAEKPVGDGPSLSEVGFARAERLPALFLPGSARVDLATPQFLFAASSTGHSSRPVETLAPLARALHLRIDESFADDEYGELAKELLSRRYAAKAVVVAWRHKTLARLAAALGAEPPSAAWPVEQYDRIWRVDVLEGKAVLRDLPMALVPGDSQR